MDELYKLIHALNKSERRYFRLYAGLHNSGKSSYLKLFDVLAAKKTYNEAEIKQELANLTEGNKLQTLKQYLYEQLLEALANYHSDMSSEIRIYKLIHYFEILFAKRLYRQAEKVLRKAEEEAIKFEKYPEIIQIYIKKAILLYNEGRLAELETELLNQQRVIAGLLEKWAIQENLRRLNHSMFIIAKKLGLAREKNDVIELESIAKATAAIPEHPEDSIITALNRNLIHTIVAATNQQAEQAEYYQEKNLALFDSKPHFQLELSSQYFNTLCNLVLIYLYQNRNEAALNFIKRLENFSDRLPSILSEQIAPKAFALSATYMLKYYTGQGDFDKATEYIVYCKQKLKIHINNIGIFELLPLKLVMAYAFLGNNQFVEALILVNEIINQKSAVRLDIQQNAILMRLILHFELKNYDILDSLTRSAYRYFLSKKKLLAFEKLFLKFVRNLSKIKTDNELINELKQLLQALEKLETLPDEATAFAHIDYVSYIKSKIDSKPFMALVKERYENRKKQVN